MYYQKLELYLTKIKTPSNLANRQYNAPKNIFPFAESTACLYNNKGEV